jgi:hypothetical protein
MNLCDAAAGPSLMAQWPDRPQHPKRPQGLLKCALSHFPHDESPAVKTRMCCAAGGGPHRPDCPSQPKRPQGPLGPLWVPGRP